jgi:acetyl esterase/lipase
MRFILHIFGLLSAVAGTLIALPDRKESLRSAQIGLNELSWFPALLGTVAAVGGFVTRPRAWLAVILGGIGAVLSVKPFLAYSAAANDMASAMRAGLGPDYEETIPTPMRKRLSDTTWSMENALGKRERTVRAQLTRHVLYAEMDGHPLALDVYQPLDEPVTGNLYPAIIVIHGGGWRNGEPGGWFVPHNHYYASQGYVVFDIEYRLSGVAKWPVLFEDVQEAIRWVKAHAPEFRVDPARIALLGRSAGAHLALMGAYCADAETRVSAVVSIYGAIELRWPNLKPESAIIDLMGGTYEQLPAAYESATPLNYVTDGLPPTLIIEGGMDIITPHQHGDRMVNALSLTDTPFVLLRAPWSRHGFDAVLSGLGTQLVYYHLDRFLAWSLYRDQPL